MALDVTQLAHRFHAADFYAADLVGHEELLEGEPFDNLVVPDFNLDTPVLGAAGLGQVACHGIRVTRPGIGNRLCRQCEGGLEMFGNLACPLSRETSVVAVNCREPWRERLAVCMADQVQADIQAIIHACKDGTKRGHRIGRDLCHTGLEVNRRYEVAELDGLESVGQRFARLERVAPFSGDTTRILDPLLIIDFDGQVALDGFADRRLFNTRRGCRRNQAGCGEQSQPATFVASVHRLTLAGIAGGPPSRQ